MYCLQLQWTYGLCLKHFSLYTMLWQRLEHPWVTLLVHTAGTRAKILENNMAVLMPCSVTHCAAVEEAAWLSDLGVRPKGTAGRSEMFEPGWNSRQNKCAHTPKVQPVQNKLVALKKGKGGWGLRTDFTALCTHSRLYSPHKDCLFSYFYWW